MSILKGKKPFFTKFFSQITAPLLILMHNWEIKSRTIFKIKKNEHCSIYQNCEYI